MASRVGIGSSFSENPAHGSERRREEGNGGGGGGHARQLFAVAGEPACQNTEKLTDDRAGHQQPIEPIDGPLHPGLRRSARTA